MEVIESVKEMKDKSLGIRRSGKNIAFVPTMGFLHEGHLSLLRTGRSRADVLVLSIFVNPAQFGPKEDYNEYPRDMEGDLSKADTSGADIVFTRSAGDMYPEGFQTSIKIEKIPQHLCGLSRPGHFEGVATIVAKLFNIVRPHIAIFGQKDYQQLTVIHRMVTDLDMGIEIVGVPTVREPDGLAMSSRNKYLNSEERASALCLKKSIDMALDYAKSGERDSAIIISSIRELILSHPFTNIEYVSICDPLTMEDKEKISGETLLALAVKVGKTRLIDNCLIKV